MSMLTGAVRRSARWTKFMPKFMPKFAEIVMPTGAGSSAAR